jgi:hypothetical protein
VNTNTSNPNAAGPNPRRRAPKLPQGWPLWLLAAPAAVSIWAGWVGLGQMCGYGVVQLLPGIADQVRLNTAITLPIGMEAYAAYALGAWLSPRRLRPQARTFAKRSALAALGLGLLGQGVYHLLETFGYQRAPWPVVLFVACLPVLVLGAGATLRHLLTASDGDGVNGENEQVAVTAEAEVTPTAPTPGPAALTAPEPVPGAAVRVPSRRPDRRSGKRRGKRGAPRRLRADFLAQAREALAAEPPGTVPSAGWCRRVTGCSERLSTDLAKTLRAEIHATRTATGTSTGTTGGMRAGMDETEVAA